MLHLTDVCLRWHLVCAEGVQITGLCANERVAGAKQQLRIVGGRRQGAGHADKDRCIASIIPHDVRPARASLPRVVLAKIEFSTSQRF